MQNVSWRTSPRSPLLSDWRLAVEALGGAEQLLEVGDDHVGSGLAQVLGGAEVAGDADQEVEAGLAARLDAGRGDVDEDRVAGAGAELGGHLVERPRVAGAGDDRVEEVGDAGQLEGRAGAFAA